MVFTFRMMKTTSDFATLLRDGRRHDGPLLAVGCPASRTIALDLDIYRSAPLYWASNVV